MLYRDKKVAYLHKIHFWDDFVQASSEHARRQFGNESFFLLADQTNKVYETDNFSNICYTAGKLQTMGLYIDPLDPSPMWSNGDYSWYFARQQLPDYDYYVFGEFDVWFNIDFNRLIDPMIDYELDVLVADYQELDKDWYHYHTASWNYSPVCSMLTVFGVYSGVWLDHMFNKRLELSARAKTETLPAWPFVEAFVGSESRRVWSRVGWLSRFFDTSKCRWAPEYPGSLIHDIPFGTIIHPIKKF